MDLDLVLDPATPPDDVLAVCLEAERLGLRAVWASNYHQDRDPFLSLARPALETSTLLLGVLAVSPWELHPLRMATAAMTLNELAQGRVIVAVSGGGGVLGALGWRLGDAPESWPPTDPVTRRRGPERRLRGVRECLEFLLTARTGEMVMPLGGEVFQTHRPAQLAWGYPSGPAVYSCASGPRMIELGAELADGIQLSDFTVAEVPGAIEHVRAGSEERPADAPPLRIGNFWAWHLKEDREASLREARRELIWRRSLAARYAEDLRAFCHDDAEVGLVLANYMNFLAAFWSGSGHIEGVPDDLVERLVHGMSSAGDLGDLDREIERILAFRDAGITELALRLGDDPLDALAIIGQHVVPALQ